MTLKEFLNLKEYSLEVTVYSHNQPVLSWLGDNDPRYQCHVIEFGVISETELYVEIDEDELH